MTSSSQILYPVTRKNQEPTKMPQKRRNIQKGCTHIRTRTPVAPVSLPWNAMTINPYFKYQVLLISTSFLSPPVPIPLTETLLTALIISQSKTCLTVVLESEKYRNYFVLKHRIYAEWPVPRKLSPWVILYLIRCHLPRLVVALSSVLQTLCILHVNL